MGYRGKVEQQNQARDLRAQLIAVADGRACRQGSLLEEKRQAREKCTGASHPQDWLNGGQAGVHGN